MPGDKKLPDDLAAEAKFAVVLETAALLEIELSEYCRRKRSYLEQVQAWRHLHTGQQSAQAQRQAEREPACADKKRIRELAHELCRKDLTLAETAAILVLRKKLDAYWGNDSEDN